MELLLIDTNALIDAKKEQYKSSLKMYYLEEVKEEFGNDFENLDYNLELFVPENQFQYNQLYQETLNKFESWTLYKDDGKADIAIIAAITTISRDPSSSYSSIVLICHDKPLISYIEKEKLENVRCVGADYLISN